jgi:hypothetical protein
MLQYRIVADRERSRGPHQRRRQKSRNTRHPAGNSRTTAFRRGWAGQCFRYLCQPFAVERRRSRSASWGAATNPVPWADVDLTRGRSDRDRSIAQLQYQSIAWPLRGIIEPARSIDLTFQHCGGAGRHEPRGFSGPQRLRPPPLGVVGWGMLAAKTRGGTSAVATDDRRQPDGGPRSIAARSRSSRSTKSASGTPSAAQIARSSRASTPR